MCVCWAPTPSFLTSSSLASTVNVTQHMHYRETWLSRTYNSWYLGYETKRLRLEPVTGWRTRVVVWRGREVVKGEGGGTGKKRGEIGKTSLYILNIVPWLAVSIWRLQTWYVSKPGTHHIMLRSHWAKHSKLQQSCRDSVSDFTECLSLF